MILHIYRINEKTTDKFVDEKFKQRFLHIHTNEGETYIIRALDFVGEKLKFGSDDKEIIDLMESLKEHFGKDERKKIGDFLTGIREEKKRKGIRKLLMGDKYV